MAESSIKRSLRPARMLTTAIMAGLALVAAALTWPTLVHGADTQPVITQVQVKSSKGAFFYSPLTDTGGSVYFNNQGGEGADQVITVTVTVSDDNPTVFSGGYAFGITPTTSISNTDGTWSVTYTIRSTDTTENGVLFAITNGNNLSNTITISFTRDTTPPAVAFTSVSAQQYLSGTRWYRTPAMTAGWAFTAAFTETGAGFDSSLATWDHQINNADDQAILPLLSGPATLTGTFTHVYTNTDGTVIASLVVTDHVSNSASASMTLGLDSSPPSISLPRIDENSRYLYAVDTGIYYGNGMGFGGAPFTVTGTASDGAGVGLNLATFSSALVGTRPPDDADPATWTGVYTASSADSGTGTIVVTVTDHVGNALTQTFAYTRDVDAPTVPLTFTHSADADSGGDGFAPDTNWEDDLTIDLSWAPSSDGGSGLRTYHLSTEPDPTSPDVEKDAPLNVLTDGQYSAHLTAEDNVGNISLEKVIPSINVDRSSPTGGNLDLAKLAGSQYLYIANATGITTGTLYYNNSATSSFVITGNIPVGNWGIFGSSEAGKVAFSASWGDSSRAEDASVPYAHTYTVNPGETNNSFTVYFVNKAGNVQPITIANTLDVTAPTVILIDVTNPVSDTSPFNELDNLGNWYRTSALTAGWTFTSSVSDPLSGLGSSLAVWNHSVPSNNQAIDPGLDGSGTFSNVNDDSDGVVAVTVTLTDHVNNAASDSVVIRLDGTPPTIATGSWGENSPYLSKLGGVLYYNPAMPVTQTATLSGTAYDNGSDLGYATFSQSPNLPSTPISDITPISWSTVYSFSSATQGNHVDVVAYDHVGNAVTATYAYTRAPGLPGVQFQNVTPPGYDPDGNPWDTQDNWYASKDFLGGYYGHGWSFYAAVTDGSGTGISAARATWDHATGPDYVLTPSVADGVIQGAFENVSSAPDGLVTVTLTITDNVGQVASTSLVLRIDNAPPAITSGSWTETSPYLYASADGSTLYFHLVSGSAQATLSGEASDNSGGSGLNQTTFSYESSIPANPAIAPDPADWSNDYYFNAGSTGASSPVAVVVSDHLGNAVTRIFTYTLDITAPVVLLTNVTDPLYDPDHDELDTVDNWYRTSGLGSGWSFTATVTETLAGVDQDQAVWDYQTGTTNDRYTTLGLSGTGVFANRTGTFAGVTGTPDGVVTVTLAVTDRVGNVGSNYLVVRLDKTPPIITPTGWSESSPYLSVTGNTLYFSDLMGGNTVTATVSGTAADAGVGLGLATFSNESPYLATSPGPAASPAAWAGGYGITSASYSVGRTLLVTVSDRVSNTITTTFNYVEDTAGPAVSFDDVTAPQYDPGGNRLDTTGNWYRTSLLTGGWAFTGTIADSLAGPWYAQATWDHNTSCSTCDQTIDPGLDGDGVFTGVYTNPDGAVTVWLRGTDNVSNTNAASLTIHLDNTPPGVPPNFRVATAGLPGGYYSTTALSLVFSNTTDTDSGVGAYYMGITPSPVVSYTSPAPYNVSGDGVYSFYLRAADNVGNLGAVTSAGPITVDTQAPDPDIGATPKDSESRILVEWGANDATTWPATYDLQYSLTITSGWQGWITNTSSISTYFGPAIPVQIESETPYCFRMRARDYVNNQSGWSSPVCTAIGQKQVFLPIVGLNFDPCIPNFVSGDFESNSFAGWCDGGALPRSIVTSPLPPNGGTRAALLGRPDLGCGFTRIVPVGQAYIKAYVNVPSGGAHLRFNYRVLSYDVLKSGTEPWDRLEVQINDTTLARYGDPTPNKPVDKKCILYDSLWQTADFPLSDYAGQTIVLTFFNENHQEREGSPTLAYLNTWSYLDNIRIETP